MLDLIITILCVWLFCKVVGLMLRVAWGVTKIIAVALLILAVPSLIGCLVFAGGLLLLLPLALIALAFGLLKACF